MIKDKEIIKEYISELKKLNEKISTQIYDSTYYYSIYISDTYYDKYKKEIDEISKHILKKHKDIYNKKIFVFKRSEKLSCFNDEKITIKE